MSETADGLTLRGMDHFTVLTPDVEKTRAFYEMLGFIVGPRPPDLRGAGLWLYVDRRPILHVIGPVDAPENKRGMLDHMAFRATGLADAARRLDARGVAWRLQKLAEPFSVWQMFFEDPFGARVEFDFDGAEAPPPDWSATQGRT